MKYKDFSDFLMGDLVSLKWSDVIMAVEGISIGPKKPFNKVKVIWWDENDKHCQHEYDERFMILRRR